MRRSVVLLLLCLVVSTFSQTCGPSQCYNGCTDARVPVDFVFIIDVSGSMQAPITGVRNGLTQFASDLQSKNVNPAYSVILFGTSSDTAVLKLNAETNYGTFKATMDAISVNGGWEPSMETIRRATNTASSSTNFNIKYRTDAKKVIILLTNEDSDKAYYSANRFQTSGNDGLEQCTVNFDQYQSEINAVVNSLTSMGASAYLLTDIDTSSSFRTSQTCLTAKQFGDYRLQVQSTDYKTFNSAETYAKLVSGGLEKSVQGQLLNAGRLCRVFRVTLAGDSTFVKNFFETITADISTCNNACYDYPCNGLSCQPPVNMCGCDNVRNSGKTLDSAGNCCLPPERDCSGICFGKSVYDACGVCVASGTSPLCLSDCGNRKYLSQKPTVAYISDNFQPDPAGYLLMNSDLYTQFSTSTGSLRSLDLLKAHFHNNGRFEGRSTCTFDSNRYVAAYGGTASTAATTWLNALLNTAIVTKPVAYCVTGTKQKITAREKDACDQCILFTDAPPYCVVDCAKVLQTNPLDASFIDECGKCVSAKTSPSGNKDDCGVCFGGNAAKNDCGVCYGTTAKDGCLNYVCHNITCNKDCDGNSVVTITKGLDNCGYCVLLGTQSPNCKVDCAGKYYKVDVLSPHIVDECGNCVDRNLTRLPACVQDCSGKWNGTAYYDDCDQCIDGVNDYQCVQDCALNYYRLGKDVASHTLDDCGICNTPANQNTLKDKCGVCTNKVGYNSTTECLEDCKGHFYLPNEEHAIIDSFCLKCFFANETDRISTIVDDCGICVEGGKSDPLWNANRKKDSLNNYCPCFVDPKSCDDNKGGSFLSCLDCPTYTNCTDGKNPDSCGLCSDNSMFGKKDECDLCCDPDHGVPCNVDKDDCGICFGFNKLKEGNPCKICDKSKCVVDCNGVVNGTAVVNTCDGVCGSTAPCLTCGDGVTSPEIGETCDLGNGKNIKGSGCFNCLTESGNSKGKTAGIIVGAIAALAFLAVAAFVAFKYAQKAGLIGKSGQKVDLSASNSNPLYKSDTNIQQNPLYGN